MNNDLGSVTEKIEETNLIAAADIGGSHITVGFVQVGKPYVRNGYVERVKLDSKGSREEILGAWFGAFERLQSCTKTDIKHIAFAMPGPFNYEKGISLIKGVDKYESLYKQNIRQLFAERFGVPESTILFRNDAEAFLHGEAIAAGFPPYKRILGITLGTGFGSAVSHNGETTDLNIGLSAFKESIADDYLTTRWFCSAYEEISKKGLDVEKISEMARNGEPLALQLFDEFTDNLVTILHRTIVELMIDEIVIGGNIAKAHDLFLINVRQKLTSLGIVVNFHLAQLGEHSAIVGSAYLFAPLVSIK